MQILHVYTHFACTCKQLIHVYIYTYGYGKNIKTYTHLKKQVLYTNKKIYKEYEIIYMIIWLYMYMLSFR